MDLEPCNALPPHYDGDVRSQVTESPDIVSSEHTCAIQIEDVARPRYLFPGRPIPVLHETPTIGSADSPDVMLRAAVHVGEHIRTRTRLTRETPASPIPVVDLYGRSVAVFGL